MPSPSCSLKWYCEVTVLQQLLFSLSLKSAMVSVHSLNWCLSSLSQMRGSARTSLCRNTLAHLGCTILKLRKHSQFCQNPLPSGHAPGYSDLRDVWRNTTGSCPRTGYVKTTQAVLAHVPQASWHWREAAFWLPQAWSSVRDTCQLCLQTSQV